MLHRFVRLGIRNHRKINNRCRAFSTVGGTTTRSGRLVRFFIGGFVAAVGYSVGSTLKNQTIEPTKALPINSKEYNYLHDHDEVIRLRNDKNFRESKYYDAVPVEHRNTMITANLLAGPGYITVEPLIFTNNRNKEMIIFYHIGDKVEGHQGIVHGGLIATLLDEGLARCSTLSLPNGYGVTGSLEVNYRAPIPSNSYIVLRANTVESKGRKIVLQGKLETLDARLLAEGQVVMIEPKWAKYVIPIFK